jgi:hypothetical protein
MSDTKSASFYPSFNRNSNSYYYRTYAGPHCLELQVAAVSPFVHINISFISYFFLSLHSHTLKSLLKIFREQHDVTGFPGRSKNTYRRNIMCS